MDVPVDRGQHHLALGHLLALLEVGLEPGHRLLHDLGALEHERQDQLARAELVPHLLHGGEQRLVENHHRVAPLHRLVHQRLDAGRLPVQDLVVDLLLHAERGLFGFFLFRPRIGRAALEVRDVLRQRLRVAVEDQVLGEAAVLPADLRVGHHFGGVDDRHVEPGLHAVEEEHRVQDRARLLREPERHVRDPEAREHAGQLALDAADALDRLDPGVDELGVAGCEREGEVVEHQPLGREPVLARDDVVDAARDLELAFRVLRHPLLVDGERDHRRAVLRDQRHHGVHPGPSVLEVDRVDQRAAGIGLERLLDHRGFGGVDHQRRLDRERQLLHQASHLLRLVGALGQGCADVERVRSALHLLARDRDEVLDAIFQHDALDAPRALGVEALADQERRRLLLEGGGGDAARQEPAAAPRAWPRPAPADRCDQRADVGGSRAAAAADDVDAQLRHELAQRLGHRLGVHRVDRAPPVVDRETCVRDAVDGRARVLCQVADRVAHEIGTGRAVETDHVCAHRLEGRERAADIGAEQHAPGGIERHGALERHAPPGARERLARRQDLRLHLEHVLAGLEDEEIGAAFQQPFGLNRESRHQVLEPQLAEIGILGGREHPGRPHRARDEARPAVGLREAVRHAPRDRGTRAVDLARLLPQAPLLEAHARGLERVGLDAIRAGLEVGGVHGLDDVGAGQREVVVAAFPALAAEVRGRELPHLELRAHPAVEEQHALPERFEETAGHEGEGGVSWGRGRRDGGPAAEREAYRTLERPATALLLPHRAEHAVELLRSPLHGRCGACELEEDLALGPAHDRAHQGPVGLLAGRLRAPHRMGRIGPARLDARDFDPARLELADVVLLQRLELAHPALQVGIHSPALAGAEVVDRAFRALAAGGGNEVGRDPHALSEVGRPALGDVPGHARMRRPGRSSLARRCGRPGPARRGLGRRGLASARGRGRRGGHLYADIPGREGEGDHGGDADGDDGAHGHVGSAPEPGTDPPVGTDFAGA